MSLPELGLVIGGLKLRLAGSPAMCAAALARYGVFATRDARGASAELQIHAREPFGAALEREEGALVEPDGADAVRLGGAVRGGFDLATRRGRLDDARGLGAVDALVRAALSLLLPLEGGLLVHGAVVEAAPGEAWVFAGASGAGKSTIASALGAACDECVVLRPGPDGVTAHATPYWRGRPFVARVRALVCLERGGAASTGDMARLRGPDALRALAGNVVRYASLRRVEHAILDTVARTCTGTEIRRARCPEGDAFVPFVVAALADRQAA